MSLFSEKMVNLSRGYNNIVVGCYYLENNCHYAKLNFIEDESLTVQERLERLLIITKKDIQEKDQGVFDNIIRESWLYIHRNEYQNNGRRMLTVLTEQCRWAHYLDKELYQMISLLVKRALNGNEMFTTATWNLLNYWKGKIKVILRPNERGEWEESSTSKWLKFGYHDHPDFFDKITPIYGLKDKESKKGFEVEGNFKSEKDFQDCMQEMSETDFEGGKLYDSRNFLMPTSDGSLGGEYPVEFWFCPMSTEFAKKFFKVFYEILNKHNWESSYTVNGSGIHCHIDACLFNQITLKKFIDKIYDMPETEQDRIYKRTRTNNYNNYNKHSCFELHSRYIKTNEKNKDGKDLYVKDGIIFARGRQTLLNLQHMRYNEVDEDYDDLYGTLELRGADGSCDPIILCDEYDKLIAETIQ